MVTIEQEVAIVTTVQVSIPDSATVEQIEELTKVAGAERFQELLGVEVDEDDIVCLDNFVYDE